MAVTLVSEFVLLFQMACVVFLFAYLFSRSRFFIQVLEHRASLAIQLFLTVVFGLLSVYGMSSGISFYTATVNIRDFGPLAGGLACGPLVGLGAGIIGFVYRLSLGGTNVYAVAIGPLAAGIIGGLIYYYQGKKPVPAITAIGVTLVTETLISAVALIVRLIEGDTADKVLTVTINVAIPMIVMTTISIAVFAYILENRIREMDVQKEKMQLELEVESKRNLSTIINTIPLPVYVVDRSHRFVLANDSLCRFLGRPREEILGKTHSDFYSGEDETRHWERVETAFRHHASREEEIAVTRPADGQVCTIISASSMYKDTKGEEFMVWAIQDITERKKMQVALTESEEWYRILFEHTGTATIIINEDGVIDQANSQFIQMIGSGREDIEGKMKWTQIAHPDDVGMVRAYHHARRIDPAKVPTTYTVRIISRDGITRTLHAVVAMIPGTRKSIASYVDISDQKRSEETLTQVNRKLNLLSSITRHDIINQILILKGFLVLLRKKTAEPALLEYIDRSEKATKNIEHQITFTRDYQDMGIKAPSWQNVRKGIISAKGALATGTITINTDRLADVEVFADPLFEKVFYNLIDNTLKYGGESLHSVTIWSEETEGGLAIIYHDDGCGIPDEERVHLFERGFGKHTGFGLFLSREILSITGISIVESGNRGTGAEFTIRIPNGMYRPAPPAGEGH